jgi:hypothetical protein
MNQPPVPDSENAAPLYIQASNELREVIGHELRENARRGLDAYEPIEWKDPNSAAMVKKNEHALALLRRAAAMPRCSFDQRRTLLDAAINTAPPGGKLPGTGATLLAIDAHVSAAAGDLGRAFDDVAAILGMVHHISAEYSLDWAIEEMAWRTLEEVLQLAPPGKDLPALKVPELTPLVHKVREEHALLGIIMPAAASQPSLVIDNLRNHEGPRAALLIQALVVPSRVFLIPDDVAAMRKLLDDYQSSPRRTQDESPADWAELRKTVENDPTGYYGAFFIKPKQRLLLTVGLHLTALRATGRAGVAVEAYRRKHGKAPDRLEQLVPGFLPTLPLDPRDGQPLRLTRIGDELVIYAPQDAATVDAGKLRDRESRFPAPIFRLHSQ